MAPKLDVTPAGNFRIEFAPTKEGIAEAVRMLLTLSGLQWLSDRLSQMFRK